MFVNVVSVVSPKGGTGKSAIATGLAASAASDEPTALYDLDPQGTSHRWFHVHRAHSFSPVPEIGLTVSRVESGGILARLKEDAAACPPKWVVCDLAGGAFAPLAEAFEVSDLVLVPLRPSAADLTTIRRLKTFVDSLGSGLTGRMAVVLCQVDRRAPRRCEFSRSLLEDGAGITCCRTHISQSVVWPDAYAAGRTVAEMAGPRYRRAASELAALYGEVRDLVRTRSAQ